MLRIAKSAVACSGRIRWLILLLLAVSLCGVAIHGVNSLAQDARDRSSKPATLKIWHGANAQPQYLLVELFQERNRLRARELDSAGDQSVNWTDLAAGNYEVHCSATGYAKSIYRILISKDDATELHVKVEKDKGAIVGGGPTIQEILEDLSQLKKANGALHARVQQLETEVADLKKNK